MFILPFQDAPSASILNPIIFYLSDLITYGVSTFVF